MSMENTQGRKLKRGQVVLRGDLADRSENELLQAGNGIGDPRLGAQGKGLAIDVIHPGIVPWSQRHERKKFRRDPGRAPNPIRERP